MHAKFLGIGIVLTIASAAGAGCSSDSEETPSNGDSGTSSSSSGGGGRRDAGAGTPDAGPTVSNDSFEAATLLATAEGGQLTYSEDVDADNLLTGTVTSGKAGYYYVDLDAESVGQPMVFLVEARTNAADEDDTKYDMHLTLFDEDRAQVAANDDALTAFSTYRDPALRTVPLAAGRYYLKVEPFCAVAGADCPAGWDAAVTDPDFRVGAGYLNLEGYGLDNDDQADKNGTPATAVELPLAPIKNNEQALVAYDTAVYGFSSAASDLDFYKLKVPADLVVTAAHRVSFNVVFPAAGIKGTGATSTATAAWIVDSTDPTKKLASVDLKTKLLEENASVFGADANVPVVQGRDYFLVVQNADATDGNYYFAAAAAYEGNPLESDAAGSNNTSAGANVLPASAVNPAAPDVVSYFVEGDLGLGVPDAGPVGGADVDFFKIAVAGKTKISVSCGAQSSGSGIRGLKATVLNGASEVTNATENATTGLAIQQFAIPAGATDLFVKLEATAAQAADVTGAFYRCGIRLD